MAVPMLVSPSPLDPMPSDTPLIVTVPDRSPAAEVSTPTRIELLSLAPPARPAIGLPANVALPVAGPKLVLRTSVKAPAGAVLVTVNCCNKPPPIRWFASTTGFGVTPPAASEARLYAAPVKARFWLLVLSKLFSTCTCWPFSAPADVPLKVTLKLPLDVPAASGPKPDTVTPPPESRISVMLPPLTPVCNAPRSAGPPAALVTW